MEKSTNYEIMLTEKTNKKTVKCIKVLGGYKKKSATLGAILITSIEELRNKSKITSKVKKENQIK